MSGPIVRARRPWGVRVAACALATLALIALFADFLASGRPVLARVRGELRWFANVTRPADLPPDLDALDAVLRPGDWYVTALVPYGPRQSRIAGEVRALRSPSAAHWLGTDRAGCDVFARLVHGARASLGVGLVAAMLSLFLGASLGFWAGMGGRIVDGLLSRFAESFAAFPPLVLLCALQAVAYERGALGVIATGAALGFVGWPYTFRIARAQVRSARAMDYVLAARALGATPWRLAVVHLGPAAMPGLAVAAAFTVPSAILLEASLAYLGVGLPTDTASWGELLLQAGFGWQRWWLVAFPGLALAATAASLLVVAEALRAHYAPAARGPRNQPHARIVARG